MYCSNTQRFNLNTPNSTFLLIVTKWRVEYNNMIHNVNMGYIDKK